MDRVTVGLDLGDRYSRFCMVDAEGEIVEEGRVRTEVEAMRGRFRGAAARVVLEVGTHSPGVLRELEELGHEVIVTNPRRLANRARQTARMPSSWTVSGGWTRRCCGRSGTAGGIPRC